MKFVCHKTLHVKTAHYDFYVKLMNGPTHTDSGHVQTSTLNSEKSTERHVLCMENILPQNANVNIQLNERFNSFANLHLFTNFQVIKIIMEPGVNILPV